MASQKVATDPVAPDSPPPAPQVDAAPAADAVLPSAADVLAKMREQLKKAEPTNISVSDKEKVNMKLAGACTLLWCIKVEKGMDIHLKTSWTPDVAEGEKVTEPKITNYGRVMNKTDRVCIPGHGTFSLMLDNSFAWFNTKGVELTYVTASASPPSPSATQADNALLPIAESLAHAPVMPQKTVEATATNGPIAPPATTTTTTTTAGLCPKTVHMAMTSWTVAQVEGWLKACGLGEYARTFTTKKIDGRCVRRLLDFSPKEQADYMQATFNMSISDSLHFGHELSKFAK